MKLQLRLSTPDVVLQLVYVDWIDDPSDVINRCRLFQHHKSSIIAFSKLLEKHMKMTPRFFEFRCWCNPFSPKEEIHTNQCWFSKHNELASLTKLMTSQHNELASQTKFMTSQHNELASQTKLMTSQHNELASQTKLMTSQHNELASQNKLMTSWHELQHLFCRHRTDWFCPCLETHPRQRAIDAPAREQTVINLLFFTSVACASSSGCLTHRLNNATFRHSYFHALTSAMLY